MPLEMDAILTAFGLRPLDGSPARRAGRIGQVRVTCTHIGMGPPATRSALTRILDGSNTEGDPVDHVMIAGICGGLDPSVPVGTLVVPELVVDHSTGRSYRHTPPAGTAVDGRLVTTEQATLDTDLSRRLYEDGFVAVDMETSAVAEVCEARGRPWSVFRCIGDRLVDGLLDERVLAMANPDGSGNEEQIGRLLADDPDLSPRLEQLARDATVAASRAAEAAASACRALAGVADG